MKYTIVLAAAISLASSVLAMPAVRQVQYPIVNLTFYGGPVQSSMSFVADGAVYQTRKSISPTQSEGHFLNPVSADNDLSIDIIDAGDYNAINQCTFVTDHEKTLLTRYYPGSIRILVGPPQPIRAVSCLGVCIDNGDFCYADGRFVGECCNGYCDAPGDRKCHAWANVAHDD